MRIQKKQQKKHGAKKIKKKKERKKENQDKHPPRKAGYGRHTQRDTHRHKGLVTAMFTCQYLKF